MKESTAKKARAKAKNPQTTRDIALSEMCQ
jgi:hypothetical protein